MDPFSIVCSAITVATAFKDIIELCLQLKGALEKAGKNRAKLRKIANDINDGLVDFQAFCTGREVDIEGSPELGSALEKLKRNMISTLLRCEALSKPAKHHRYTKFVEWYKQDEVEEEMLELKEKISNYHTHFITWSSLRNELNSNRLLAQSMEQQSRLKQMNMLIQHGLLDTPQGHAIMPQITQVFNNPITRDAIETQYLSLQINGILERIAQAFPALEEAAFASRTTASRPTPTLELTTRPLSAAMLQSDLTIEVLSFARKLEIDPATIPDPIHTLRLISTKLKQAQRYQQSLALDIQIVALSRRLAVREPLTFLPRLSPHLIELATSHLRLGQYEEASKACHNALVTLRTISTSFPELDLRSHTANALAVLAQSSLALNHTNEALAQIEESLKVYKGLLGEMDIHNGPGILQGETNISTTLNAYQALLGYVDVLLRRAQYAECFHAIEEAWRLLLRITPDDLIRYRTTGICDLQSELPLRVVGMAYEDKWFSLSRFEKIVVSYAKIAVVHSRVVLHHFPQMLVAFNYVGLVTSPNSKLPLSPDTLSALKHILSHDGEALVQLPSVSELVLPIQRSADGEVIARAAFRCFFVSGEGSDHILPAMFEMMRCLARVFPTVAAEETRNHFRILDRIWKENYDSIIIITDMIETIGSVKPTNVAMMRSLLALLNEFVEFCRIHRPKKDGKWPGIVFAILAYPAELVGGAEGWRQSWTTAVRVAFADITRDLEMQIDARWHPFVLNIVWTMCASLNLLDITIECSLVYLRLAGERLRGGSMSPGLAESYFANLCRCANALQHNLFHTETRRLIDDGINTFVKGNLWSNIVGDKLASHLIHMCRYHEALAIVSTSSQTTHRPTIPSTSRIILQSTALYALDAGHDLAHDTRMALHDLDGEIGWGDQDDATCMFFHMSAYHFRAGRCQLALRTLNPTIRYYRDLPRQPEAHGLYDHDTDLPSALILQSQILWTLQRLGDALDSSGEGVRRRRLQYQTRPWLALNLVDMIEILRSQLLGVGKVEAAEELKDEAKRIRGEWARHCESPKRQAVIATVTTIVDTSRDVSARHFSAPNPESQSIWDERLSAWKNRFSGRDVDGSSGPPNIGSNVRGRGRVESQRIGGLDRLSEEQAQRQRGEGSAVLGEMSSAEQGELEDILLLENLLFVKNKTRADRERDRDQSTTDRPSIVDDEDEIAGDIIGSRESPSSVGLEDVCSSCESLSGFPGGFHVHDDPPSDVDVPSVCLDSSDEAYSEAKDHLLTCVAKPAFETIFATPALRLWTPSAYISKSFIHCVVIAAAVVVVQWLSVHSYQLFRQPV